MYVRSKYDETSNCYCQRYSNNSKPLFSDQEILTIYLFVGSEQGYTRIKGIHSFAKEYLLRDETVKGGWLETLPTKAFALQRICITMDSSFTVLDIEGKGICLSLAILFCPRHRRMTSLYSSEIALPNSSENRYMPIKSIRTAFSGNRRRIRVICYSPQ